MRINRNVGLLGVTAALAVAMTGCASSTTAVPSPSNSGPGAEALALLTASSDSVSDYDTLDTPDEIAALSEIVVSGRVLDVQPGPVAGYADDELSDATTVMIAIGEVELIQGELAPDSDGMVYVPLLAPSDPEEFGELIPIGSEVVFYGNIISEIPAEGSIPINSFSAGRPEGQPMYGLAHPQGLVFDVSPDNSGDLVWPASNSWADAPIEDALPGGDEVGEEVH